MCQQGRLAVDSRKARSLQNSAMHLRKACNHPYLFLAGQVPPYEPPDPEELIRASGKLHLLDNILPKLQHTGGWNGQRVLSAIPKAASERRAQLSEHYTSLSSSACKTISCPDCSTQVGGVLCEKPSVKAGLLIQDYLDLKA